MSHSIGIDFGTTNSAIAIAEKNLPPRLLSLPTAEGARSETWRSVLFFEPSDQSNKPSVSAGSLAIGRYLDSGGDGRFIQSAKSHLASRLFNKTNILYKNYALEDLIGMFLLELRSAVDIDLGDTAVVGRPVRYWGAKTQEDDARAIKRMTTGLAIAGFKHVIFENEPSAAAAKYAENLECEEIVLIADYGGGTSDFCLLKLSSDNASREILGTGGYGIGGDTFDGCLIDSLVAPCLGKGSQYGDGFGELTEIPSSLYSNLRRWHHLAFLKSKKSLSLLERILSGAEEPKKIENFVHIIENDLGLPLHRSIVAIKEFLTHSDHGTFCFMDKPIDISAPVTQKQFSSWISPDLDRIDSVIDDVLLQAGVQPEGVSRVFATGGSSLVPAVRKRLEQRFPGKLDGGDELTSVALGLAERARVEFGS